MTRPPWPHLLTRRAAALALAAGLAASAPAADSTSPIRPYYDFVHWFSIGRADLALEQFSADAIVVAGPLCTDEAPCVGHAAIRTRYFGALASGRTALPLVGQRFDGRRLHTRAARGGEVVFEGHRMQWQVGHVFKFRDGRIAALRLAWEVDNAARSVAPG